MTDLNASGAVTASYAQGAGIDEPLASNSSAGTAFFEADGLGSVTSLSGMIGITDTYTYNAFGMTTATGSNPNRFRYTAREYDPETGLYYYRARYYDPQIGRFKSEDPIQFHGGIDFYAYVHNNPVNLVDPRGLEPPIDPDIAYRFWHGKPRPPAEPLPSLGRLGCVLKCEVIGFADDAATVGLSLVSQRVRAWLLTPKGAAVTKMGGACALAAATLYCSWRCDVLPTTEVDPDTIIAP